MRKTASTLQNENNQQRGVKAENVNQAGAL